MPPPPPPVPFRLFRLASREPSRVRRRATNVRRLDSAAQPCSVALRARYVEVLDEAAEGVVRDELLALELDARRGRGVVGLEPLLDGAALVGEAVGLFRDEEGRARVGQTTRCSLEGRGGAGLYLGRRARLTVVTGLVMISAVIEQMHWLGTTASLAFDGPAASLPPPLP